MSFLCISIFVVLLVRTGTAQNCGFYRTKVGDFDITVLSDGYIDLNTQFFYNGTHPAALRKAAQSHFLGDTLRLPSNPVYVDTGLNKVMIDTGTGTVNRGIPNSDRGHLIENMKQAGLDPNEVDTVLISHAHLDHLGGVTNPDGSFVFPNAKYVISRQEYEFFRQVTLEDPLIQGLNVNDGFKAVVVEAGRAGIQSIRDRLMLVEFGVEIVPGITSKGLVGETPGEMGFVIRSGNDSMMYIADAIVQEAFDLEHPEWVFVFEMLPSESVKTKFSVLEELAASGMKVQIFHFPFPGIGRIIRTPTGYGFRPAPYEF